MPNSSPLFQIICDTAEVGWEHFEFRHNGKSWKCQASWIGDYPLTSLIPNTLDLYTYFYDENFDRDSWSQPFVRETHIKDEPGGLSLHTTPIENTQDQLLIEIFYYADDTRPTSKTHPKIPPVSSFQISYWDYAYAVYEAAAKSIAAQGIIGLQTGWLPSSWITSGKPRTIFPVEEFLYLAALIKHRKPVLDLTLQQEINLLQNITSQHNQ